MIDPRPLGTSSALVPAVGMGCNNFSRPKTATATQEGSTAVIHAAIDAGVAFFDGAELYGAEPGLSETFMGVALRGRRDEVVLASKFGHDGGRGPGLEDAGPTGRAPYIRQALEGSLRRLKTDHLDLYQMHLPDPSTPIEETLGVLSELVDEGKVLAIGNSNFSAEQLREADAAAEAAGTAKFVSAQNEYSLLARAIEADVLPTAQELGLGVLPYFPLYNGLLTGKYTRGRHRPPERHQAAGPRDHQLGPARCLPTHLRRRRRQHVAGHLRLAAVPPRDRLGHLRRHPAGAGARQRRGRHDSPARRRAGRDHGAVRRLVVTVRFT